MTSGGDETGYGWFVMLFAYYVGKKMGMANADGWLAYFQEFKEPATNNEEKINKLMKWASQNANHLPAAMPIIGELQRGN